MKIGLIDVDSHNFPNLCLMKISAYHKSKGDCVEWCNLFEHYDKVYMSRVFDNTYTDDFLTAINADEIIKGGTGYDLENRLPGEIEHQYPDYSLYPDLTKNTAYGFLTRGCPNNCPFCIVSKKEGRKSVKVANLSEFWSGQKYIKLLDPNLLACNEHINLLQQLRDSQATVDFTQGLDARLVTKSNIKLLSQIKVKTVHFAFDLMKNERKIVEGLKLYKESTGVDERKTGVYILTNYNTTHEEDLYRVYTVRDLGYMPYVMIYNKPDAPKITKDLQRWCNNRFIYRASEKDFSKYRKGMKND
jgi:hypothetical protein|nr:MAG TPA: Elongator protein 3, MiaB family, Radical SAM [Caudoviricetes sp.]